MTRICLTGKLCLLTAMAGGCGDIFAPNPAPLFSAPLTIDGDPVGSAIIDTGGGYELLLRDSFGLTVVDTAEVVAFGGKEVVGLTEGFEYTAGGWPAVASSALVGLSVCDCNGLGFFFFRKTGAVLVLDFPNLQASFLPFMPHEGTLLSFEPPPPELPDFDSSFIDVEVQAGTELRTVRALLDTGTNASVMRQGLVGSPSALTPNRLDVVVTHDDLGSVAVQVRLFETGGLPDLILGTDVMRAWADRWYFSFVPDRGRIAVMRRVEARPGDATEVSESASAFR